MSFEVVAHRGFTKRFPENTLGGYEDAIAAGADVVETDLHLTADGSSIVICHNLTTGKVYDKNLNVYTASKEELLKLRTKAEPHTPIPWLEEVLDTVLVKNNAKLMLDIKSFNKLQVLDVLDQKLQVFFKEHPEVPPANIQVGVWNMDFYKHIIDNNLLGSCKIIMITFMLESTLPLLELSASVSKHKLDAVSVIHIETWNLKGFTTKGHKLYNFYHKYVLTGQTKLYLWTVNSDSDLEWAYNVPFVNGVISDRTDSVAAAVQRLKGSQLQEDKDPQVFFEAKLQKLHQIAPKWYTLMSVKRYLLNKFLKVLGKVFFTVMRLMSRFSS